MLIFTACTLNLWISLHSPTQVRCSCSMCSVEHIFSAPSSSFSSWTFLPRLTVEILCCSAKALHLPVITSHPSLPRLLGVKPAVTPFAPWLHSIPSPLRRHVVIMLSAPWAFTLGFGGQGLCVNTAAVVMPAACFSLSPEWPGLPEHCPTMPHSPVP